MDEYITPIGWGFLGIVALLAVIAAGAYHFEWDIAGFIKKRLVGKPTKNWWIYTADGMKKVADLQILESRSLTGHVPEQKLKINFRGKGKQFDFFNNLDILTQFTTDKQIIFYQLPLEERDAIMRVLKQHTNNVAFYKYRYDENERDIRARLVETASMYEDIVRRSHPVIVTTGRVDGEDEKTVIHQTIGTKEE